MTTNYIKLNELVGKIKQAYLNAQTNSTKAVLEDILPELAESKDEKIRKAIYGWINTRPSLFFDDGFSKEEMLAWLEKQGEQKLTNSYCQEHCKGFQETGKCFADGDCKAKTIAETVHAGTENILNELADRIEKAEIVNVRQVLEWIEEQTKK